MAGFRFLWQFKLRQLPLPRRYALAHTGFVVLLPLLECALQFQKRALLFCQIVAYEYSLDPLAPVYRDPSFLLGRGGVCTR